MSALSPPPKDPLERSRDQNIVGRMLLTRLVSLIIVDDSYPDGPDDVREMMLALDDDAISARADDNIMEANGCDRARAELVVLTGANDRPAARPRDRPARMGRCADQTGRPDRLRVVTHGRGRSDGLVRRRLGDRADSQRVAPSR